MSEIWTDIKGYEHLYEVSNLGRVRTHKNKITHTKRHGPRKWKQRILCFKEKNAKTGYRVDLWNNGKPKTYLVARLVAFTFYGKDIENKKLTVNHKDGNRFNNNLDNLEIISLKENIYHAFETGLYSSNVKINVINKYKEENISFSSMTKASIFIGKSKGYISGQIKRGIYENSVYIWNVV